MTDTLSPTATALRSAFTTGVEKAATKAARKDLKALRTRAQVEAAAYVATFTKQVRTFTAKAVTHERAGRPGAAKEWAGHAVRALKNLDRVRQAIAGA